MRKEQNGIKNENIDFRFCIVSSDINLILMNVNLDFDKYIYMCVVVYVSIHGLLYLLRADAHWMAGYLQFRHSATQSAKEWNEQTYARIYKTYAYSCI